ncbi:MAG: galactose-1-phosphate uridylyltransferase [bacterium]
MSELRKDPIISRWVVISPERAFRPHFKTEKLTCESREANCPFCEGNEHITPPEILAYGLPNRKPNTVGWQVRVVPNKFPALKVEGELSRWGIGLLDKVNGIGAHEVVIETPNHNQEFFELSQQHIALILRAWKDRIEDLDKDNRLRYALVFKNKGDEAGASISHPHSQIIATPITPNLIKQELISSKEYYSQKERCIFCDYMFQEISDEERIVYQDEHFVLISAYASRVPYEVWILPREHSADYINISDDAINSLSLILKGLLRGYMEIMKDPPYNLVLHTAPLRTPRPGYWLTIEKDFHWHIEILPRMTRVAGFEWGTGLYINPVSPEEACLTLRNAFVDFGQ